MSQQLISHSPDLKRLRDEGYEIEVRGGYLLIHHIPFVDDPKRQKAKRKKIKEITKNRSKEYDKIKITG